MSEFVLDASLTMTLCLREGTPHQRDVALTLLQTDDTAVPDIWTAEVRNVLVFNERRGRISPEQVDGWFSFFESLPIAIDPNPDHQTTLVLARAHRLTFYDALYLELAQRRQATLATLDAALLRAADAEGVPALRA